MHGILKYHVRLTSCRMDSCAKIEEEEAPEASYPVLQEAQQLYGRLHVLNFIRGLVELQKTYYDNNLMRATNTGTAVDR